MCCRCREEEAKEGTWRMAEGAKKTHTHTDHSKQQAGRQSQEGIHSEIPPTDT